MSGGVDSSVAAALLKEQGHEVIGITLRLRRCEEEQPGRSCCGVDAITQARAVCGQMSLPHFVYDCHNEFEECVLRYSWEEYAAGRTPNPCVVCNEQVKFGLLLERARALGAKQIATGHYARIEADEHGQRRLRRGRDANKDQSYFLFALSAEQLAATLMPLGAMTKAQVRQEAQNRGLVNAQRAESQDACFVDDKEGFAEVLRRRFNASSKSGEIVDTQGRVFGRHDGIHRFTVGQRRGLGVAFGQRAWVKKIEADTGRVIVATEDKDILARGLFAKVTHWSERPLSPKNDIRKCAAQIRYRHQAAPAHLQFLETNYALVIFDEPVRAITPGQAVVFYDDDLVLGGGWIERPADENECILVG